MVKVLLAAGDIYSLLVKLRKKEGLSSLTFVQESHMEVYFFKPRRSQAPRLRAEVTRATLTARWRAEFFSKIPYQTRGRI